MRVLHVIARMNVGGTATYLFNLIQGLENLGIENSLAVGQVPKNEKEDSRLSKLNFKRITNMSRSISPLRDFRARKELWNLIDSYKPDLIHAHTFKAGLLVRTKKTSIPIIHTFHGHHLYDPDYGFVARIVLNFIERKLAKRSRKILTIGKKVGEELLAVRIGKEEQFISIPPGVEKPDLKERGLIEKKFDLQSETLNVLWMGRLSWVKRPDRAIELAKRFPNVNFILAGDGELRAELASVSPQNVQLLGVQSPDEMLSIADVVLLTSDSEGMPLTLIEGQMAGVPTVATDVGSVSEIIFDTETGFISSTNLDEISSKLGKLLSDDRLRVDMGILAQIRATKLFSIDRMVISHVKVYQEVLK